MKETYLSVWGAWLLPPDLRYSLEDVRNWAKRRGLAGEERFIGQEILQELRRFYPDHTRVGVLVHLNRDPAGRISYEERPFVSVPALIMRNEECRGSIPWLSQSSATVKSTW